MSGKFDQTHVPVGAALRGRHRVGLELELHQHPDGIDPEDWDLSELDLATRTGRARLLRTIRGLVLDSENDPLSTALQALADEIDEASQLHWLAVASGRRASERVARSPRPSLDLLVELEHVAAAARQLAQRLEEQGL